MPGEGDDCCCSGGDDAEGEENEPYGEGEGGRCCGGYEVGDEVGGAGEELGGPSAPVDEAKDEVEEAGREDDVVEQPFDDRPEVDLDALLGKLGGGASVVAASGSHRCWDGGERAPRCLLGHASVEEGFGAWSAEPGDLGGGGGGAASTVDGGGGWSRCGAGDPAPDNLHGDEFGTVHDGSLVGGVGCVALCVKVESPEQEMGRKVCI